MKLKLRFQQLTLVVDDIEENSTVSMLKERAAETILAEFRAFDSQFQLSLNGKDPISESDDTPLHELGIVSGDIVKILVTSEGNASMSAVKGQSSRNADDSEMQTEEQRSPSEENLINRYLYEPLLCRESTSQSVPALLKTTYFAASIKTKAEAYCLVLHVMMCEAGFKCLDANDKVLPDKNVPTNWYASSVFRLSYSHYSCPGKIFKLICIPIGPHVVTHGWISGNRDQLPPMPNNPSDFVNDVHFLEEQPATVYKNLAKLSHQFKDAVAYAILVHAQEEAGLPRNYGFLSLPEEVRLLILSMLNVHSLVGMSMVCKDLQILASESILWKKLFFRDFATVAASHANNGEPEVGWKQLYKLEYLRWQERRFHQQQSMQHQQFPYPIIPYPPRGGLIPMPGVPILGGEFDLYPGFPFNGRNDGNFFGLPAFREPGIEPFPINLPRRYNEDPDEWRLP